MPRNFRIVVYSVLLVLALYMYWVSGRPPIQAPKSAVQTRSVEEPFRAKGSLNVRREALTDAFGKTPYNLRFDFVPLADGGSRVVGRSADGRTVLELIGPPEGLTSTNLMTALPEDRPLTRLKSINAIFLLIETTLYDWSNASDWVGENIDAAFAGEIVYVLVNDKSVSMSVAPGTDTLNLTVSGPAL